MPRSKKASVEVGVVFPVAGRFLNGVPAAPLSVDDFTAERLVRTGAFTHEGPALEDGQEAPEIQTLEMDDAAHAALDHYDPLEEPERVPAPETTEDTDEPADAGEGN